MITKEIEQILKINKSTIWLLVILSVFISLFSLVVPFAVQTVVNTLAFTTIKRQFILVIFIVVFALSIAGILRTYQLLIVEHKEQELFYRLSTDLALRLPRIKFSLLNNERYLNLVNRFLDVSAVQKTVIIIMIYMIELLIQATTGFILLAVYHPLFLLLDGGIIILMTFSLLIPYKRAKEQAYQESNYKHQVISWLQEYLAAPNLFKLSQRSQYLLKKIDKNLVGYLSSKQGLIGSILQHFFGLYGAYIIANASLLGLGGYLILKAQLSLGQLVAGEIVLNLILTSFLKLTYALGSLYELVPACKKISRIYELDYENSLEKINDIDRADFFEHVNSAPSITFSDISYADERNYSIFSKFSSEITKETTNVYFSEEGIKRHSFIDLILGNFSPQKGSLYVNNLLLTEQRKFLLREKTSFIKDIEIFDASIIENLTLGNENIKVEEIHFLLEKFGLNVLTNKLPEKENSNLVACQRVFSKTELYKLMLIREILAKPYLFLIDTALDFLSHTDVELFIKVIEDLNLKTTLVLTTAKKSVLSLFKNGTQL